MANITFNDTKKINVKVSGTTPITVKTQEPSTISTSTHDINYIPGYKEAEEERRVNEITRQSNETARENYINDLKARVQRGEFKGDKGDKGDDGEKGDTGAGVVIGGTTGQVLAKKSNTDYDTEWINTFSGDYTDLTNKPTIPSKTSDLTNDSGFIDNTYHDSTKQDVTDNSLVTTNKTVPGAISELSTRISNIQNIGRFLAIWNCATGLPTSEPATTPYTYKTGDYFRVGTADNTTNYMPNGSSYTGTASTTEYTGAGLTIGAVFYYDGSVWRLQASSGGGTVQDVQVNGTSMLSGGIANIQTDNSTITKNNSNQLQAVAVKETNINAIAKTWVGTTAQYNAIATKDNNTLYYITDDYHSPELLSNKVTSLSGGSTDDEYPSAKCVYDLIGDIESLLGGI